MDTKLFKKKIKNRMPENINKTYDEMIVAIVFVLMGAGLCSSIVMSAMLCAKIVITVFVIGAAIFDIAYYLIKNDRVNVLILLSGAMLGVTGYFLYSKPMILIQLLPALVGTLVVVDGFWAIQKGLKIRKSQKSKAQTIIFGTLILTAFAVVLIVNPFSTIRIMMIYAGALMIANGIFDFVSVVIFNKAAKIIRIENESNPENENYEDENREDENREDETVNDFSYHENDGHIEQTIKVHEHEVETLTDGDVEFVDSRMQLPGPETNDNSDTSKSFDTSDSSETGKSPEMPHRYLVDNSVKPEAEEMKTTSATEEIKTGVSENDTVNASSNDIQKSNNEEDYVFEEWNGPEDYSCLSKESGKSKNKIKLNESSIADTADDSSSKAKTSIWGKLKKKASKIKDSDIYHSDL